jgi:phage shock protein PspC (stress-responsive transcriptional regulator)
VAHLANTHPAGDSSQTLFQRKQLFISFGTVLASYLASPRATSPPKELPMQADTTPLPYRHDTLFGVCEGLGRTLGINPNILRIVFGILLLWNPVVVACAYVGCGVLLALVHWLVPDVRAELLSQQVERGGPGEAANCDRESARAA